MIRRILRGILSGWTLLSLSAGAQVQSSILCSTPAASIVFGQSLVTPLLTGKGLGNFFGAKSGIEKAQEACMALKPPKDVNCGNQKCQTGCSSCITLQCSIKSFPNQNDATVNNPKMEPVPFETGSVPPGAKGDRNVIMAHVTMGPTPFPCDDGERAGQKGCVQKQSGLPQGCAAFRQYFKEKGPEWSKRNSLEHHRYKTWDGMHCPSPNRGIILAKISDVSCSADGKVAEFPTASFSFLCIPPISGEHQVSAKYSWAKTCINCADEKTPSSH
jgi:hypothetical protein